MIKLTRIVQVDRHGIPLEEEDSSESGEVANMRDLMEPEAVEYEEVEGEAEEVDEESVGEDSEEEEEEIDEMDLTWGSVKPLMKSFYLSNILHFFFKFHRLFLFNRNYSTVIFHLLATYSTVICHIFATYSSLLFN